MLLQIHLGSSSSPIATQAYSQSTAASAKMSEKGAMSPDKALFGQVMPECNHHITFKKILAVPSPSVLLGLLACKAFGTVAGDAL